MKTSQISDSRYLLPDNISKTSFLETLGQYFTVKEGRTENEKIAIIDSFEWGLYKKNTLAIRHEDHSISLYNEENLLDSELAMRIENISARSRFCWDFPDSPAKDFLTRVLGLRALYPVFNGSLKIEHLNLQDKEGKILVFCQLTSLFSSDKPRTPLIRQLNLFPVTGYPEEFKQAVDALFELGAFEPTLKPLDTILNAIGVTPQPYNVKPKLSLSPQATARASVSTIISTMIEKQRLTEFGVIKDIDTEFLHHFRVALRMVRAAITQLKEVFPQQDVTELKARFDAIGRETNQLRDLDVFILDKSRYLNLLPVSLRDGLLPMFNDFESSRATEVKRIGRWLSSRAYKKEMEALQALFEQGYSSLETEWSEKSTIELAITKIHKRYKKIQKASAKITHETPDEAIHSIRIDCKKLRYLLYFFGNLFNKKQVKTFGAHLKSLQDILGIFNDLSVQSDFLENYLYKTEHKAKKDILLIASLGGLIASLNTLQLQEREKCIKELAVFSNKENQILFKETFIS